MVRTLQFLSVSLLLLLAVGASAQKGRYDVNRDKSVNSADVVAIYNYITSGDVSGFTADAANVNGDTDKDGNPTVNSADVVAVYNYIINGDAADEYTANGVAFRMVPVDGGMFKMGDNGDAKPVHEVTLSDYAIGQTEVTQELWETVMGSNPSVNSGVNLPVQMVSWEDCQTFIKKLNTLVKEQLPKGKVFRLPTEAEWEFAARGGKWGYGYKYSGSDVLDDVAWFRDNSDDTMHPVGSKQVNELGIFDMSGNIAEWCWDWYGSYSNDAQTNPTGPTSGSRRIYRGGGWDEYAILCRSVRRNYAVPTSSFSSIGFRLVLTKE